MTKMFRNILIASVILSLNAAPIAVYAMPEPVPATQTDKQKAAEKKKKEAEKAKAQKAKEKAKAAKEKEKAKAAKEKEKASKEKEKAKAAQQKAKESAKAQEQREKEAAERAEMQAKKEAAEKAREEKALRDYEKYQADLANPKTEAISYFNLGLRLGYAAMMDKIQTDNISQQLLGGAGAGLDLTYNLEYGHFLFETGLDFRFLNSTSNYGFTATRYDQTYGATYNYLFDKTSEMRNMFEIGLPVMFGAQFSRYYFLVGAKVHYGLPLGYTQKGQYDIVVNDPAMLEPYGMGIYNLNGQTNQKIQFKQPDISVAAEVGLDLDEWLQKQPDPKSKKKVQPGQRLPFGREHIHYRVALFAEYGVLNTNATPAANPVEFATNNYEVQRTNTMLAMNGNTALNNLFVGAKFAIQFEVPGKKARPVPPPASYAIYSVVDANTNQPLANATIETKATEGGKIALREKQINAKGLRQKHALGAYTVTVKADGYYDAMQSFDISQVGSTEYVTIVMRPQPIFRVRVTNAETGQPVPTTIEIRRTGVKEPEYKLITDSISGSARQMFIEGRRYSLHIAQMGYERVDIMIPNNGDTMNIALKPIKKGEVFIVKNLFFATNKTRILKTSEEALQDLYMYLARNPKVRIKIIGHTDNVGKDAANQKLSEGRANEVMKDLIERGIAPDRLQAEGRGESQPIDTNDTEEGRQNNRRVEIEIL